MSLKGIAKQTLEILDQGSYVGPSGTTIHLKKEVKAAVQGTKLYTPDQLAQLLDAPATGSGVPIIEVTDETTQRAARRLVQDEGVSDLVLLNFASARNAGGGFLKGAKAQEEDVTRCSGLYPCLLTQPTYYQVNRQTKSLLYTDHMIYSPAVPWFRVESRSLIDEPFLASVITAPAPNAGKVLRRNNTAHPEIEACLRRRAGMVLALAQAEGHRTLLLGAWGCGVFRNDSTMVADAFGTWLSDTRFAGAFDRVIFAILDRTKMRHTLHAVENRFSSEANGINALP